MENRELGWQASHLKTNRISRDSWKNRINTGLMGSAISAERRRKGPASSKGRNLKKKNNNKKNPFPHCGAVRDTLINCWEGKIAVGGENTHN